MKNMIRKISTLLVALVMVLGMMPAMEAKADYDPTADLGEITINGVTKGDVLIGYKIINITFDALSNTTTYTWAHEDIRDAITTANNGTELTVEEFAKKADAERQRLLAGVPAKVSALPDLTKLSESTAGENKVTWSNVGIGGYLIVPQSTNDVYQTMLAAVQPVSGDSGYTTEDSTFDVKNSPLGLDKSVNVSTTGITKKVTFTIVADVPTYPSEVNTGVYDKYFGISDIAGEGLTVDFGTSNDGIKVYGYTNADKDQVKADTTHASGTLLSDTYYHFEDDKMLEGQAQAQTFAIEFEYDLLNTQGYKMIKIVYDASVNENADLGNTGNNNHADMTYNNYPYTTGGYKTTGDDEKVYTYRLNIVKVNNDETVKLAGAEFDVYRLAEVGDSAGDYVTNTAVSALPSGNYIKVGSIGPTNSNGEASIDRLDVGTYYLVETKAPTGYTLLATAQEIILTKKDDNTVTQSVTNIKNSTGFNLPQTGGAGTILFSVVGIALMAGAVVVFIVMKRKEPNK